MTRMVAQPDSTRHQALGLIRAFTGQAAVLTIPRIFVDFMESLEGGLFLSQLLYWSERVTDPAGWFYKSDAHWQQELGLSRRAVRAAAVQLKQRGIIELEVKPAPVSPVAHYRLNQDAFISAFTTFIEARQLAPSPDSRLSQVRQSIVPGETINCPRWDNPYTHKNTHKITALERERAREEEEVTPPPAPDSPGSALSLKKPSRNEPPVPQAPWPAGQDPRGDNTRSIELTGHCLGIVASFYEKDSRPAPKFGTAACRRDVDMLRPQVIREGSAFFAGLIDWAKDHTATDAERQARGQWPGMARWCTSIQRLLSDTCLGLYYAVLQARRPAWLVTDSIGDSVPDWRPPTGAQLQASDGCWGQIKCLDTGLLVLWEDGRRSRVGTAAELALLGQVVEGVGEGRVLERVAEVIRPALAGLR